jgi:hypothetical protein
VVRSDEKYDRFDFVKKKMEILTLTQDCLDSTLSLFFLNKQTLTERESLREWLSRPTRFREVGIVEEA